MLDTYKRAGDLNVHRMRITDGELRTGQRLHLAVDPERRLRFQGITINVGGDVIVGVNGRKVVEESALPRLDHGPQARPTGTDHHHVVAVPFDLGHEKSGHLLLSAVPARARHTAGRDVS